LLALPSVLLSLFLSTNRSRWADPWPARISAFEHAVSLIELRLAPFSASVYWKFHTCGKGICEKGSPAEEESGHAPDALAMAPTWTPGSARGPRTTTSSDHEHG
jgi:hypothetical protein